MNNVCQIVGAEVVTALGFGLDETWSGILARRCGLQPMTQFQQGRYITNIAAEIPANVSWPAWANSLLTEKSQAFKLAQFAGTSVLRQVPGFFTSNINNPVGLVLATTKADMPQFESAIERHVSPSPRLFDPFEFARVLKNELGLSGPVLAVSNACASGLIAIIQAVRMIQRGDVKHVLVIGVDVLSHFILSGFSALNALSNKPCQPFDANRCGLSLGEGAGALLLTGESSNIATMAEIIAWGNTNDANHITGPSRTGRGLSHAIEAAFEMANLSSEDIDYINSHGTGTVYNDAMEAKTFRRVFKSQVPPVASLKGYFGHTLGAAGVIETALCLPCMQHNIVPATMGFSQPDPECDIPVCCEHRKISNVKTILNVKSGFGGINAAVVLRKKEKL